MKKRFLILAFLLLIFIPLIKLNAKVCDGSNIASFGAATCSSKVGGYTCPQWSYTKVYGFQNDDMVVVCYKGKQKNGNPMLYFDLYAASGNSCVKYMSAGYWNNTAYDGSKWEGWASWSNLKTKSVTGNECPVYMYQINETVGVDSFEVYLTDDVNLYNSHMNTTNKFLWWTTGGSTGGGTIEDIISEDSVISCVENYIKNVCINNPSSSEADIQNTIKDKTKSCVEEAQKNYGVALDQAAVDRFTTKVSDKIIASNASALVLECQLMKKCSALKTFKTSNPVAEVKVVGMIANKTATVDKLKNEGVSDDLANCLMNNAEAALGETTSIIETTTTTVGETTATWGSVATGKMPEIPGISPDETPKNCEQILGKNLTKIVKAVILILQIGAAIIAIVKGMITLIPAITAKDTDGLKKAEKQLVLMAVILIIIFLLKPIISFIGGLFDYDLTCIL